MPLFSKTMDQDELHIKNYQSEKKVPLKSHKNLEKLNTGSFTIKLVEA